MGYTGSIPDTLAHRHDWMADMACRNEKPEIFSERKHEHEARVICAVRCRVRAQCLAHVTTLERGDTAERRDGVVAALTAHERWRLDAKAPGHGADRPVLAFTGEPPQCGTYLALLRHLALGEQVDHECWSGEVRRERLDRATRAAQPEPAKAAEPTVTPKATASDSRPPAKGSTPHERRVYRLWADGCTDLQIARRMAISVPEVQRTRSRLGLLPHQQERRAAS